MGRLSQDEIEHRITVWESCARNTQQAAKELGLARSTLHTFIERHAPGASAGSLAQTNAARMPLPGRGATRYLLTCAQNNTRIHSQFFENLQAYADHLGASLKVSRFTYNKTSLNQRNAKGGAQERQEDVSWDPKLVPFFSDEIELLAPTLAWCGNLQILPTAVRPWTGFQDYTGEASTVIPHPRVSMVPVATPRSQPTKHLYTTGAVTLKNYIPQKAGQKAEFHHSFAALLVEVLPGGEWFARQLVADNRGTFCDLTTRVCGGEVQEGGAQVAAIQWGDVHVANVDPRVVKMYWGKGGVLDTLRPKRQLFHDLVDGESHNHHAQGDHHHQFRLAREGKNCIRSEFLQARDFVDQVAHRPWCQGVVVWSNHDLFLTRYLQSTDYRRDHTNASFILELELEAYRAIESGRDPHLFQAALKSDTCRVLTDDAGGLRVEGIEAAFHGHAGKGGSRGSVMQFASLGMKTMSGHSHAAWWIDGATSAGTCSNLDLGYNKGPSDWSHTFTVVLKGGKRQQITANASLGMWRA